MFGGVWRLAKLEPPQGEDSTNHDNNNGKDIHQRADSFILGDGVWKDKIIIQNPNFSLHTLHFGI